MLDFCTRLRFAQNDDRGLYLAKSLPHNGFNPMRVLRHVQLGISCEDQETADERIPLLLQTPAAVRFISAEPLLGPISFRWAAWEPLKRDRETNHLDGLRRLDWVITGGESGPKARPSHPDWFRSLRDQCNAAGVPFFFKQWGEWVPMQGQVEGVPVRGEKFIHHDGTIMGRAGKKKAGRTLDGRIWDEYPEVPQ